jgi:hypothetical protein
MICAGDILFGAAILLPSLTWSRLAKIQNSDRSRFRGGISNHQIDASFENDAPLSLMLMFTQLDIL